MSSRLDGFNAASAGEPYDATKPTEWIEGYYGYFSGRVAMEAADKKMAAEVAAWNASPEGIRFERITKAKMRARLTPMGAPRSL